MWGGCWLLVGCDNFKQNHHHHFNHQHWVLIKHHITTVSVITFTPQHPLRLHPQVRHDWLVRWQVQRQHCKVAGSSTGLWTEESNVLVPGLKPALDQTVSRTPTLSPNMSANRQTADRWPRSRLALLWTIYICASSSLSWLTVHYTCTAVTLTASANGRDWLCANHELIYCAF